MSGFIILHRKILDWEWYSDTNTRLLFIHCLLKANWENKKWKNTEILRGQFVTSLDNLSIEVGLSVKQIRLCLDRLKRANNLAIKTTNKYSLITVVKYEDYQSKETEKGKQEDKQKGSERATTKQYNNKLLSEIDISEVELSMMDYFKIAREFQRLFILNLKSVNAPTVTQEKATFKNYVTPIRLMMENKEATREDLIDVWKYLNSNEGSFWKKNILSTSKLREQMPKLIMSARELNKPKKDKSREGML